MNHLRLLKAAKFLYVCCCALLSFGGYPCLADNASHVFAKSEPAHGCYLSAFVGPDPSVRAARLGKSDTLEAALGRIIHKDIAVEWQYFYYDDPGEVAAYLRVYQKRPFVMEIALEPRNGLEEVRNDATLHRYAQMMADYRRPVFLRFASEMNGNWTPYSGRPALYRQKFRLVHDVMAQEAPNVVMIWCVNYIPQKNMDDYYPGDRYVDWVGVDFYSVIHHNNDIRQPAWGQTPTSMLDDVYRRYASRKPIAICEYGASHAEALQPGVDRSDWAASKLTQLLGSLPTRYPRVKMVGLLNVNTMQRGFQSASPKANNFCFTDSAIVCETLRRVLKSDYYLSQVVQTPVKN